MIKNSSILLKNPIITYLYTIFCNKKQNHFYFFSKPVTIGTNPRSVVYQRLFAQICIFKQDTIGYKRYKSLKKQGFATV
jgi:hypothetical protein|tara:strand:- start:50 stop:286 length:237 start_codon:yes stop_codon:yes gene_type:complete